MFCHFNQTQYSWIFRPTLQIQFLFTKFTSKKLTESFGCVSAWRALRCPDFTLFSIRNDLPHTRSFNTNSKWSDLTENILFHTEILSFFYSSFHNLSMHQLAEKFDPPKRRTGYESLINWCSYLRIKTNVLSPMIISAEKCFNE